MTAEDLAGYADGTPERFVPALMHGELVEAEHLARYSWAARYATGRAALDAGCGAGYGTRALADAGATSVVGVDLAAPVLEAIGHEMPESVELCHADVGDLPFEDGTFDLITCFEVVEHVADPEAVLDELRRVASAEALVLVSSPNRDAYVPGNPHHVHEYLPEELRDALARRFRNVALLRQHDAAASLLLPDDALDATGTRAVAVDHVAKLHMLEPGREPYVLAVASDAELPALMPFVCLTEPVEIRRWVEHFSQQQRVLDEQRDALRELAAVVEERRELGQLLWRAETETATIEDLRETLAELRHAHAELIREHDEACEHLRRARIALHDITHSRSWQLTAPLRGGKRIVRERL